MSRSGFLEKLLDGVDIQWLPLGVITQYEQPTKYLVKTKNYSSLFTTPVLTAGKTFILGYTDENDGIYKASVSPVIIFDDFTSANKWVDFDFKAKSSAMKMITSTDDERFILKYIYYWMNTLPSALTNGDHKRLWISVFHKKLVPIPCPDDPEKSLTIQAEVVRILDSFTELETELEAELEARKKQYDHYLYRLLSFEDGEVSWRSLGEIATLRRGRVMSKGYLADNIGEFPVYSSQTASSGMIGKINSFDFDGEYVSWTTDGANAGTAFYRNGKFSITNVCGVIKANGAAPIDHRFLYYWLTIEAKKHVHSGMGNPKLMSHQVEKIPIPVPCPDEPERSLAIQGRIVEILDAFDTLANSISKGLPREIELRQKQYRYYRDLLFNFPNTEAMTE